MATAAANEPQLFRGSIAYDQATRQVILVGDPSGSSVSQTWAWTTQAGWKRLSPTHSMPGRTSANAAYDDATSSVVLFGGQSATPENGALNSLSDMWSWDGNDWTQLHPSSTPGETVFMPMDYEAWSHGIIGVRDSADASSVQTWRFDGTTWTQLHPVQSPPAPKKFAGLAYAPALSASVLFGTVYGLNMPAADDTTWTRSSATWVPAASNAGDPPPREFPSMSTDARGGVLMFGGGGAGGAVLADTYEWMGAWSHKTPPVAPPGRTAGLMTYDSTCKLVVLYGGEIDTQTSLKQFSDTWVWDGQTWMQVG